ncbi:MAG: hypothetical protein ACYS5V_17325 [Planctomycetota bacterium]|jgi:hypothetical protein
MKHLLVWTCATAVMAAVSTAPADVAPPDYRGAEGATCQEWDFLTGLTPTWDYLAPDGTDGITDNPYGTPLAQAKGQYTEDWGPGPGGAWSDYTVDVFVQNRVELEPDSYKKLRVQATCTGEPPAIALSSAGQTWTRVDAWSVDLDGWTVFVEDWLGEPNPHSERITLSSTGYLSEVIVDTICIPEPAACALLAAGCAALLRRVRAGRSARRGASRG